MSWPESEPTHVFPSQSSAAFAAVDVSHGMIPCGHLSIAWFSMDHVHTTRGCTAFRWESGESIDVREGTVSLVSLHFFEEICTTVLPVEGLLGS